MKIDAAMGVSIPPTCISILVNSGGEGDCTFTHLICMLGNFPSGIDSNKQ